MEPSNVVSTDGRLEQTLGRPVPALDGVRGLAIVAVLLHQLVLDVPLQSRVARLLMAVPQAGWLGVQLFFVLSGFLITGILLDTRDATNRYRAFYARRALRIFPPYYLLLATTFVIVPRFVQLPPETVAEHEYQWQYWSYLSNWRHFLVGGRYVTSLGHCWSLAVEEQFYLVWPPIVFTLRRRPLAILCGAMATTALVLRFLLRMHGYEELAYAWTPARVDGLAIGALAAIVIRERTWSAAIEQHLLRATLLSGAAVVAIAPFCGLYARLNLTTMAAGYSLFALFSGLIILMAVQQTANNRGRLHEILSTPILQKLGRYSYAIYVWHLPLHLWVSRVWIRPRLIGMGDGALLFWQTCYFVIGTVLLLALGATSYLIIEGPILSLKRYFVPGRASAHATRAC